MQVETSTATHAVTIDFSSEDFLTNPWPTYSYLRANDPVHWSEPNRCFFLFGYKHVLEALKNPDLTVDYPFRASRQVIGRSLIDLDGPDHQRLRRLLATKFAPASVDSYAAEVMEPIVNELLDAIIAGGSAADFMSQFAVHLPIRVMARLIGIPDQDAAWVYQLLLPIMRFIDYPRGGLEQAVQARAELNQYIQQMIEEHRRVPASTIVGQLIGACDIQQTINEAEIVQQILLLLAAGTETTIAAIGNMLVCLLRHPEGLEAVQQDLSLVPMVVRETLRWEPPLHGTLRFARKDLEIDGVRIRRGTAVQVNLASANRDAGYIPNPDVWDPSRQEQGIPFGSGRHMCLGFRLAQQELEIGLRIILTRLTDITAHDGLIPDIYGRVMRGPRVLHLCFRARS